MRKSCNDIPASRARHSIIATARAHHQISPFRAGPAAISD
jgi:hypothetical protein